MPVRVGAFLACMLALWACGTPAEHDPFDGLLALDIPLDPALEVERARPRDPQQLEWLSLHGAPTVLVDMAEDEAVGADLQQVVIHPSGQLFIADLYSSTIRRMNAVGEVDLVWGRAGSGPNEFHFIRWMEVDREGRLVVYDSGRARITVWSLEGQLLSEARVSPALTQLEGQPRAILADGSIVFVRPIWPDTRAMTPGELIQLDPEIFLWTWEDPMAPRRLGTVPGPISTLVTGPEAGGFRSVPDVLFTPRTVAFGDGLNLLLLNTGNATLEALEFAHSEPRSKRVIDLDIFPDQEARVDPGDVAREREALLAAVMPRSVGPPPEMHRARIRDTPHHPFRPRLGDRPNASGAGRIWISGHRSRADEAEGAALTPWCRMDLATLEVGPCVQLPSNQDLLGTFDGHLLVRENRDLGLARLLVWKLSHVR